MSGHSPIDKGTQIKADLSDFGIYGLYILTREGLPQWAFIRYWFSHNKIVF
ncbi:MAG: hypothetical protein ACXACX_07585 [Candidatus Hodarchaeales archaeon]|jgi:hypothetical protein